MYQWTLLPLSLYGCMAVVLAPLCGRSENGRAMVYGLGPMVYVYWM